jgi:hypothetical protein
MTLNGCAGSPVFATGLPAANLLSETRRKLRSVSSKILRPGAGRHPVFSSAPSAQQFRCFRAARAPS